MSLRGGGRLLSLRARHLSFLLLLVQLPACTAPPPPEDAPGDDLPASSPLAPPPLPGRSEFVDNGLAISAGTRAELRAALGEPLEIASATLANRHVPGVMDTIYTLHYPGLSARFHHPGGGSDLLSMVHVSDNRHLRYPVIGREMTEIEAAFGPPDASFDSSATYLCTTCQAGDDPVELVVEDGEVRRVRFNYYVD